MLKNFHLKFLALILAILFWIFVVSIQNVFATLPFEISVKPVNLSENLALVNEFPNVKVTVRAEESTVLRRLTVDDFEATVDVKNLGAGEHTVEISVDSENSDIRILRVTPEKTMVKLEPLREEFVPVIPLTEGAPKSGYETVDVTISGKPLRVRAAESVLENIEAVFAVIRLEGKETRSILRKPDELVLKDNEGKVITNVEIEEGEIIVNVLIGKQIPVEVVTKGELSSGTISKLTPLPNIVRVEGDDELISKITSLKTESLDLSEISGNTRKKLRLVVPEGVTIHELSEPEVEVIIEVVP